MLLYTYIVYLIYIVFYCDSCCPLFFMFLFPVFLLKQQLLVLDSILYKIIFAFT
jgi:hypothetical protein